MARLAAVGYYGFGNYGDELFREVLNRELNGHRVCFFPQTTQSPYFVEPLSEILRDFDGVIIGGGDLMIPWSWPPYYFDEAWLIRPTFLFNVGVPTWSGEDLDVVNRYRRFVRHPNVAQIFLRDPESAKWVEDFLEVKGTVFPDMAWSEKPLRCHKVDSRLLIVLRAGQTNDHYKIAQRIVQAAHLDGIETKFLIGGIGETAERDLKIISDYGFAESALVFTSLSAISNEISKSKYILSDKFHVCLTALAEGCEVLGLSGANKFRSILPDVWPRIQDLRQMTWRDITPIFHSVSEQQKFQNALGAGTALRHLRDWANSL
jgi:polysaccharide pyruvyl transferase WcaK-like protein